MSQNYLSAFARVTTANDVTSRSSVPQYQQLAAFSMPQMNSGMFPATNIAHNVGNHGQSGTLAAAAALAQDNQANWTQISNPRSVSGGNENMQGGAVRTVSSGNSLHHVVPSVSTANVQLAGTPLLEWNGREWITPQPGSLAAVAIAPHQVSIANTSIGNYSSLTPQQLNAWTSNSTAQNNHQDSQHQSASAAIQVDLSGCLPTSTSSYSPSLEVLQSSSQSNPSTSKRKIAPKPSANSKASRSSSGLTQLHNAAVRRDDSTDDLLSAEQLTRMAGNGRDQLDLSRDPLLALLPSTTTSSDMLLGSQQQNHPQLEEKPARPNKPFDGRFAVCPNCGTLSNNYNTCESCQSELPDSVKMYDPEAAKLDEERKKQEKAKKIENEKLLLQKLKEEQLKKQIEASLTSPSKTGAKVVVGSTSRSFYGRKISVKDYSDDDPAWTPNSASRSRGGGGKPPGGKRGRKVKEAEVYIISSSTDDDDDDEEYTHKTTTKATTRQSTARQLSSLSATRPDVTRVPELYMRCTRVNFGSLHGLPKEPLHITISGVDINIETDTEAVKVRLDNRDVKECLGCTHHKLPLLIFRANQLFGQKVRQALRMRDATIDPYYDPDSSDPRHKYIVAYLDDKMQISNFAWRLQEIFRAISLRFQTGGVLLRFIDVTKAEKLLMEIAGKLEPTLDLSGSEEIEDEEDLPPPPVFEGPVKKMFSYPFPPASNAIPVTNEDFHCLYEGEFLNDVILSFYLRYLTDEVISPEDKERTFVFSSYFYTCLTQSMKGAAAKDTKKPLAERRHGRVKSWTKNVDIFSKDFIIIPINEHFHWFLAIICFPYLDNVVYADDGQSSKKVSEDDNSSDEPEVTSTTADTEAARSPATAGPHADKVTGVISSASIEIVSSDSIQIVDSLPVKSSPSSSANKTKGQNKASSTASSSSNDMLTFSEDPFGFDESDDNIKAPNKRIAKRPCILIFDSLAGPGHGAVIKNLRDYLSVEWKTRKDSVRSFNKDVIKGCNVNCPQQNNYSDCGVYLLQYVENFFKTPITDWRMPLTCTVDWFDVPTIKRKRKEIQQLMTKLETEFAARPPATKGRPARTTRKSVADEETTAKSITETTLSTSVPEALGLAQTSVPNQETKSAPANEYESSELVQSSDKSDRHAHQVAESNKQTGQSEFTKTEDSGDRSPDIFNDAALEESGEYNGTTRRELEKMEIKDESVASLDAVVTLDSDSQSSVPMDTDR